MKLTELARQLIEDEEFMSGNGPSVTAVEVEDYISNELGYEVVPDKSKILSLHDVDILTGNINRAIEARKASKKA